MAGIGLPVSHSVPVPATEKAMRLPTRDTYMSSIPGYIPDAYHRDVTASWDIPVVYVIIEQLQLKIQEIEEELIRLRTKTCHCQDEGFINRQADTANAATQHESPELQDGNTDHNENDQSMETSEKTDPELSINLELPYI